MPSPVSSFAALRALIVIAICGQMTPLQASNAISVGLLATARLIAAPQSTSDGVWTIGVVITLKPKAITYWRDPGEAGVPPRFDFSASINVAATNVAYPAPKRIREGDIDAIGYDGEVVFPVRIVLANRAAPASVRLTMDYATCERICLPAHADLSLDLPAPPETIDAACLARAQAAVPSVLDADAIAAVVDVVREGPPANLAWRVRPKRGTTDTDLFSEGPEGFFLQTTREGDAFRVTVAEHPAGQAVPDAVRFTLTGAAGAVEFSVPGH